MRLVVALHPALAGDPLPPSTMRVGRTFVLVILLSLSFVWSSFALPRPYPSKPADGVGDAAHKANCTSEKKHDDIGMTGNLHPPSNHTGHQPHDVKGISQVCQEYYSADTDHAVCRGDTSVMCHSGCAGAVFAQNCQLNETSPRTNQTCKIAFSKTSLSAYLCTTEAGAYTCAGPMRGQAICHNCVPTNQMGNPSTTKKVRTGYTSSSTAPSGFHNGKGSSGTWSYKTCRDKRAKLVLGVFISFLIETIVFL